MAVYGNHRIFVPDGDRLCDRVGPGIFVVMQCEWRKAGRFGPDSAEAV